MLKFKMMEVNEGNAVTLLIDGHEITVPVEEFYKKMKIMFLQSDVPKLHYSYVATGSIFKELPS